MSTSICAVLCVRNEVPYLAFLLPWLASLDVEAYVIDNGSTDGTRELCRRFRGNPVIGMEDLIYRGVSSLTDQLQAKHAV